jgi:hypothetical protein
MYITYPENVVMIHPSFKQLVMALFVFLVFAPWWPSAEPDRAQYRKQPLSIDVTLML